MTKSKRQLVAKFKKAASTNSKRVHIVPSLSGWSVKKEGSTRSSAVRRTKEGAIAAARSLKSVERIVVHKKDGTIQSIKKRRK